MDSEKEGLTAQQSLDIISSMINQTKVNALANTFYFLLWGWTIAIANIGVFLAIKFTELPNPPVIFAITIPAAIATVYYSIRQDRSSVASTPLDKVNKWMWIGYGITCFVLVYFGKQTNWQINAIIMCMTATPTFVTGIMLKFRPLLIGGVAFWIFGIACFLVANELQFLLAAIAIVCGYIIPGYMLKASKS
jgi:hypothetical protein